MFCKKITFSFCSKRCNRLTFFLFDIFWFLKISRKIQFGRSPVKETTKCDLTNRKLFKRIGYFFTFCTSIFNFSFFQSSLSVFNLYFHFSVFNFHFFYFNFSLSLCSHFTFDLHDLTNRNIYTLIGSLFTRRTMKILSIQ